MSELAFAKQFLTALDARPAKLGADSASDPRGYPAQPAYILPRHGPTATKRKRDAGASANPPDGRPPSTAAAAGGPTTTTADARAITVTLTPLKGGAPVTLPALPPSRSVYEVRELYAAETRLDVTKVRLLRAKRPVADSKSLGELLGDAAGGGEIEFSVMVMGGAAAAVTGNAAASGGGDKMDVDSAATPVVVAQGASGADVARTAAFWDDLAGFLLQRVRDEGESKRLLGSFKRAWESSEGGGGA